MKQWLIEHLIIWKKWLADHFTQEELISVLDTFGAEVTGMALVSYQSFVNGEFTLYTGLGLVAAAGWRSAYKALRKLATIYWTRLGEGGAEEVILPPPTKKW